MNVQVCSCADEGESQLPRLKSVSSRLKIIRRAKMEKRMPALRIQRSQTDVLLPLCGSLCSLPAKLESKNEAHAMQVIL